MTTKMVHSIVLSMVLGLSALVSGCGGGDANIKATTTTQGQELKDLDKAYKEGILTEKEYEKEKKKILKRKY